MTGPGGVKLVAGAPAGGGARALAYLIDLVAVVGVSAATWPLHRSFVAVGVLVVELAVVVGLATARTGRSPGSMVTRMAAARVGTDLAPGLGRQTRRFLLLGALHATVLGPVLTVAFSRNGQDWIDRLCGTAAYSLRPRPVVTVAGVDPYGRLTADRAAAVAPRRAVDAGVGVPAPAPPVQASPVTTPPAADARASFAPPGSRTETVPVARMDAPQVVVVIDTGERIPLTGVLVFGREPALSGDPAETAVVVDDRNSSVSRTHLRLGVTPEGIWAEDSHSANGTILGYPDGRQFALVRGQRAAVPLGSTLFIGDRRLFVGSGG